MGQAKRRGTFDDRRAQAITKAGEEKRIKEQEESERRRLAQERWDALSEEEKEAIREKMRQRRGRRYSLAPLLMLALGAVCDGRRY